jgi:hypothetical protein
VNKSFTLEVHGTVDIGKKLVIGVVPQGVRNPLLQVTSPAMLAFQLMDHSSRGDQDMLPKTKERMSYPWKGLTVDDKISSKSPLHERVSFFGDLPEKLSAAVVNQANVKASFSLAYSYEGFVQCPVAMCKSAPCPVPSVGCARFVATDAAPMVDGFSKWLLKKYASSDIAWNALAPISSLNERQTGSIATIPWQSWESIWDLWPDAHQIEDGKGAEHDSGSSNGADWKVAFHFIDSFQRPDDVVSKAEFVKAFNFHDVYPSLVQWTGELHGADDGKTDAQAWQAIAAGQPSISLAIWQSIWEKWYFPSNVKKAVAGEVLPYFDYDADGVITEAEFGKAYTMYYNGKPIHPPELSQPNSSNSTRPHIAAKKAPAVSAKQSPTAKLHKGSVANGTVMTTTTMTHSMTTAPFVVIADIALDPCYLNNTRFEPLLQGSKFSKEASMSQCQLRCRQYAGCTHFAFWHQNGHCELAGKDAHSIDDAHAVAGPPTCAKPPPHPKQQVSPSQEKAGSISSSSLDDSEAWIVVVAIVLSVVALCVTILCFQSMHKSKSKRHATLTQSESREVNIKGEGLYEPVYYEDGSGHPNGQQPGGYQPGQLSSDGTPRSTSSLVESAPVPPIVSSPPPGQTGTFGMTHGSSSSFSLNQYGHQQAPSSYGSHQAPLPSLSYGSHQQPMRSMGYGNQPPPSTSSFYGGHQTPTYGNHGNAGFSDHGSFAFRPPYQGSPMYQGSSDYRAPGSAAYQSQVPGFNMQSHTPVELVAASPFQASGYQQHHV